MPTELTYQQTEELKKKLRAGTFDANLELIQLIRLDFDPITAKELLAKVIKSYKDDLYNETKEKKELEDRGSIAFGVTIMTSIMVALLGGNNGLLILISIAVACGAGYYGYPNKPIAAVVGFAFGAIVLPFACAYYLRGRESFINVELLIPIFISFGPGFLIKYVLSRMLYSDED
ncbi:hypothetical protein EV144_107268 [Flavobacterium sp. 270]|uniref:hypothetical protein n=1 Tax=Flavobacterium sp. 270 TaxID=2512114 RepID=UPI0010668790|nr:hypothetical protein [Flavobacterium sp. 270]TDW46074.1 hypothetical protein EV144_107268 [Flavobacterium sp. 270]